MAQAQQQDALVERLIAQLRGQLMDFHAIDRFFRYNGYQLRAGTLGDALFSLSQSCFRLEGLLEERFASGNYEPSDGHSLHAPLLEYVKILGDASIGRANSRSFVIDAVVYDQSSKDKLAYVIAVSACSDGHRINTITLNRYYDQVTQPLHQLTDVLLTEVLGYLKPLL